MVQESKQMQALQTPEFQPTQSESPQLQERLCQERLWQERLESIKAAVISAIGTVVIYATATWLNQSYGSSLLGSLTGLTALFPSINPLLRSPEAWLVGLAIAAFSGFLFGITYRHLVSVSQDSHLRSGAIGAFGLVRGLAQVDLNHTLRGEWLAGAVLAIESFGMFAIAALLLDWALRKQWVKPFAGGTETGWSE
ncbi:hypothetical protein ACN4EG_02690 [Alkalinema pantanalense CENA528]|uniref:hypothetical protein n=1 Tax=Alkalinema pantanalense TaxID=1620705 RepID=UPI003D6DBA10